LRSTQASTKHSLKRRVDCWLRTPGPSNSSSGRLDSMLCQHVGSSMSDNGAMGLRWHAEATPTGLTGANSGDWLQAILVPNPKADPRDPRCVPYVVRFSVSHGAGQGWTDLGMMRGS
jgi:hypothetical protein